MVQATSMWWGAMPANEMTSGFKVVQERSVRFAKQNAEACFALASELANAKDIQDILAIQSRYAQTQMQAFALQAQELGRPGRSCAKRVCQTMMSAVLPLRSHDSRLSLFASSRSRLVGARAIALFRRVRRFSHVGQSGQRSRAIPCAEPRAPRQPACAT